MEHLERQLAIELDVEKCALDEVKGLRESIEAALDAVSCFEPFRAQFCPRTPRWVAAMRRKYLGVRREPLHGTPLLAAVAGGQLRALVLGRRSSSYRCATTPPSGRSTTRTRSRGSRSGHRLQDVHSEGRGGSALGGARAPFARRLYRTKQPLI